MRLARWKALEYQPVFKAQALVQQVFHPQPSLERLVMYQPNWNRRQLILNSSAIGAGLVASGLPSLVSAQSPLTVGFIYVGPRDDYGYNQAHAESAAALKAMPGIKVLEE